MKCACSFGKLDVDKKSCTSKEAYKIVSTRCEKSVCVCIPILVTTFPKRLSGMEPLPHTPGAVRPSSLCL